MNLAKELAGLERMTVGELQAQYVEVFGESPRSRHRRYLIRRIAWRLQANAEGGLSERARQRAAELADPAEARTTPPHGPSAGRGAAHSRAAVVPAGDGGGATRARERSDPRLPPIGTVPTRRYKGRTLAVTVEAGGFIYEGERYTSLSAVAKAITGNHMNGFRFFGLEATP
ncbi:MAG: DUF2924 domain-containing protein [Phycisphaerae bacterium]